MNWSLVTQHAAWSPRAFHQALSYGGKMWVIGGGSYTPGYQKLNDVWSSEDGVNWTKVGDAPWPPRIWFSAVTYRGYMWIIGGWSKGHGNYGDVWYSSNGKEWKQLDPHHSFKQRHEASTYVYKGKIWIAAGHADPITNEVWSLEVSRLWLWRKYLKDALFNQQRAQ